MRLVWNWREILRRAWSIRLMLLAALLSGFEVALPFFMDSMPRGIFAGLSFLVVASAFVARLVAQKGLSE
jgi:polyferredoxin